MKILMVIDSLGKGGKERRMLELIKELTKQPGDFDIYLVSLTNTVDYKYVYDLPVKFEILERAHKKGLSIPFKLRKIIKSFKPDIVHSWGTMASVYLAVSNLFSRIPLINGVLADAHANLNLRNKHYLRVKLTTPFSDVFISNSEAGIRSYRTPLRKSACIYNGIDFRRFENLKPMPEIETEVLGNRKEDRIIIAMVATFDERKDYSTLVDAAIKMCPSNKNLVFLLIGNGPTLGPLKNKVPAELIDKQIVFTGRKDDIESILQIIDIGILMTNPDIHGEGVSNSIIEYMASGKPVIASRGGGTDEVIKDGFNGYLVDPKKEDQVKEKLDLLLHNKTLSATLGKNAYKWVREQFDIEKKTQEYINLYDKLSGSKKRAVYNIP
jgi:glycosyltransferase involved in cell wall biosynthesis